MDVPRGWFFLSGLAELNDYPTSLGRVKVIVLIGNASVGKACGGLVMRQQVPVEKVNDGSPGSCEIPLNPGE